MVKENLSTTEDSMTHTLHGLIEVLLYYVSYVPGKFGVKAHSVSNEQGHAKYLNSCYTRFMRMQL